MNDLPDELVIKILTYCSPRDIFKSLFYVCSKFRIAAKNDILWATFYNSLVEKEKNFSRMGWFTALPFANLMLPLFFEDLDFLNKSDKKNKDAFIACSLHRYMFALRHNLGVLFPFNTRNYRDVEKSKTIKLLHKKSGVSSGSENILTISKSDCQLTSHVMMIHTPTAVQPPSSTIISSPSFPMFLDCVVSPFSSVQHINPPSRSFPSSPSHTPALSPTPSPLCASSPSCPCKSPSQSSFTSLVHPPFSDELFSDDIPVLHNNKDQFFNLSSLQTRWLGGECTVNVINGNYVISFY